ncbi:MAG: DUF72 domain-containing protein [Ignavibacteriae bacterium]|nr:DUF72 domain-containing protein [Ignavibacteriota bacterium]
MEKRIVNYLIGTGGWEHESFDGCFYRCQKSESKDKLRYYSAFFDTVEVRSTFWDESLTIEDARNWMDAVAENRRFVFNLKLHSSFTHKKVIRPEQAKNVRSLLQELARNERLGSLLAQFPYSFANTTPNRYHLVKLAEVFRGFTLFVELRHNSWNHSGLMSFLDDNSLHPVSADLPRINKLMPFITGVIGERAYLRLHGRNERGWMLNGVDTRYDYQYNAREIRELSRRLVVLAGKCSHITIICNNTTGGKAIASALQLISATRNGKSVLVPEATLKAFPFLSELPNLVIAEKLLLSAGAYRQAM